ncbi:folylpolyglutamate synthase, mitochondrial-like isoform X2 [Watersipora subatra]|uniref:folylpolyglutamate synthase, mitochondrial-like isoform X2 n=1 Tax=Watersipora subatra TaxID=2589382 RepID=UPI00355C1CC9
MVMSLRHCIFYQTQKIVNLSRHLPRAAVLRHKLVRRALAQFSACSKTEDSHVETGEAEEAMRKLADLQTNVGKIEQALSSPRFHGAATKLEEMQKVAEHLRTLKIQDEDLNNLNVVHITGTKGKGSTAALTESILRKHGYKTGFYSSPHLVNVTERIRLDGAPISKDLFAENFWQVHDELFQHLKPGETLPFYFHFLTLLALRTFIREKVDVAILEVGIGGRYDCTNIISQPICTAVTSLALDHTNILGNTIEEIAWQKAGIFKPGVPAVTINQPDPSANQILSSCASEVGCPLYIASPINTTLGVDGEVQQLNAGIAVQLARLFIDRMGDRKKWCQTACVPTVLPGPTLDPLFKKGLAECKWPGRFHRVKRDGVTYYFDGAHTPESITLALDWFIAESLKELENLEGQGKQVKSALLFNKTGSRCVTEMLLPLSKYCFDVAVFASNIITSAHPDHVPDRRSHVSEQMAIVKTHQEAWIKQQSCNTQSHITYTFPTLSSAIAWLSRSTDALEPGALEYPQIKGDTHLQVFVTGSLYLVGNSFAILGENIC